MITENKVCFFTVPVEQGVPQGFKGLIFISLPVFYNLVSWKKSRPIITDFSNNFYSIIIMQLDTVIIFPFLIVDIVINWNY